MLHICLKCGSYHADQIIDPAGPYTICPECGHKRPFHWLPLLIVSGASGTGKSTVCQALSEKGINGVPLDSDILWSPAFNTPETGYRDFFETCLRVCMNISQAGRPVVLFGAGIGVPDNLEACIGRRYFPGLHYLALTCDDEILIERLSNRPAWRQSADPATLQEQIRFNQWFKTNAVKTVPQIELLDTTAAAPQETLQQVITWIGKKILQP
jgi:hypothetical protein